MNYKLSPYKWSWVVLFFCILTKTHAQKKIDSGHSAPANIFNIYRNPDKVLDAERLVFENASTSPKRKVNALLLMAGAYSSKRNYKASLECALKARKIGSTIHDDILNIQILYELAAQYQQLKMYDKAITYLDESEKLSLHYPYRDSIEVLLGNNYVIRGFIYKEQLNCDIAIHFFKKGIKQYQYSKLNKDLRIAANSSISYYNMGNCYIMLSKDLEAKKSFIKAFKLAEQTQAKSLQGFSLKGIAEVYTLEENYNQAIASLEKAITLSKDVGDLVLNQGIYKGLSENYLAINEWDKYQNYYKVYLKTKQEIKESERKSISNSLDENELLKNVKWQQAYKANLYKILGVFLLTLFSIILMVFKAKKIKKANAKLQKSINKL